MNKTALVLMDAEGVLMGILPNTKNQKLLKKYVIDAIENGHNNEVTKVKIKGKILTGETFTVLSSVPSVFEEYKEEQEYTLIETTIYGKV